MGSAPGLGSFGGRGCGRRCRGSRTGRGRRGRCCWGTGRWRVRRRRCCAAGRRCARGSGCCRGTCRTGCSRRTCGSRGRRRPGSTCTAGRRADRIRPSRVVQHNGENHIHRKDRDGGVGQGVTRLCAERGLAGPGTGAKRPAQATARRALDQHHEHHHQTDEEEQDDQQGGRPKLKAQDHHPGKLLNQTAKCRNGKVSGPVSPGRF